MVRFLVGQIILALTVVFAIALIGGRGVNWLHPALWIFIMVIVLPVLAVMSVYSWGQLRQTFLDAVVANGEGESRGVSSRILGLLESCLYLSGAIALVMGLIVSFARVTADLQIMGFRLGASMMPVFYSLILAMTCRVLRAKTV